MMKNRDNSKKTDLFALLTLALIIIGCVLYLGGIAKGILENAGIISDKTAKSPNVDIDWSQLYPFSEDHSPITEVNADTNAFADKLSSVLSIGTTAYGKLDFAKKDMMFFEEIRSFGTKVFDNWVCHNRNIINNRIYLGDGYYASVSEKPFSDSEMNSAAEKLEELKNYLDKDNIPLLYVQVPQKISPSDQLGAGVTDYYYANRDAFTDKLSEKGIDILDLKVPLLSERADYHSWFYRTDHHWTAPAGFWASKVMAEGLNKYCGYNIDLSIYDEDQYDFTHYENCWVGEQGQMISEAYIGRDDYTLIRPKYDTNYTMNIDGADTDGDFNLFINDYTFSETNVTDMSWHYAYGLYNTVNHNADYGKVLMLTDSYDNVTVPFVSLGVRELDNLQMRDMGDDFDLKEYILEKGYDTVIISYAQFMIGAHDNPVSSNYRMFAFDGN